MTFPIFIPSRGRAGNTPTTKLLDEAGLAYSIFVEPQEVDTYWHAQYSREGNIVPLGQNSLGIGYARWSILQFARDQHLGWFWMLDDDLTGFYEGKEVAPGVWRARKADTVTLLTQAESLLYTTVEGARYAVAGLNRRELCWTGITHDAFMTSGCCAVNAVAIHAKRTQPHNYDPRLPHLEDVDFSLGLQVSGKQVVRFNRLAFTMRPMGQDVGGCAAIRSDLPACRRYAQTVADRYAPAVTVHDDPRGYVDVKIDWKRLKASSQAKN
jgi:hypothetical protein